MDRWRLHASLISELIIWSHKLYTNCFISCSSKISIFSPRPYQYVLSVQTAYLVRQNERISEELPTPNSQAVPSVCLSVCLFVNLSIFHPASFLSAISVCFISVLSCICTHIYLLSIVNPSLYHGLSSYPCLAISLSHSFRLSGNSRSLTQ